jgi:ElaB/YqjD/DUF883 family membrane-anchored ribosome-binding protein
MVTPMDAQGRNSASDITGLKDQAAEKAAQFKETVADLGRKAGDKLDEQRVRTAKSFDNTAAALHEGGERLASKTSSAAHATADKIQVAADYLRDHDAKAMVEDLGGLIKRYPGQALAAAVFVGFMAGRALRNNG